MMILIPIIKKKRLVKITKNNHNYKNLLELISNRFFCIERSLPLKPIRILYISIAGNTKNFVNNLTNFANEENKKDSNNPTIEATEVSDQTDFAHEHSNFFAFVPTYLDGGNGIDNGVKEMMTNALGEYIAYDNNRDYCIGVVGSGNKNFNEQYCLSAKRYAESFDCPFVSDFELRGTDRDLPRIYNLLKQTALKN